MGVAVVVKWVEERLLVIDIGHWSLVIEEIRLYWSAYSTPRMI